MDLSIIIVSHGHDAMLRGAVASLVPALRGLSAELILVDNLNQTAFAADVGEQPFEVRIVKNPRPMGLSRNTNQAATMARGEFVLMMNPDTEYHQGKLADAVRYLHEHPHAGTLGCKLLYQDGTPQRSFRHFPTAPVIFIRGLYASRWPWQPGFYRRNLMQGIQLVRPTSVDWMLGAWLLMRREDFFALRGLDERFMLYYEDIDLCYRIHARGQSVIYFPDLVFYHRYARGSAKVPMGRAWRIHAGSICKYFWKHRYLLHPPYKTADAAGALPASGAA